MRAIRLQTEYLTNPMGLDIKSPRFFWNCEDGIKQTAYQIVVTRNKEVIWDSGKMESDFMTHIEYAGKELKSRDILKWQVRLWDEKDQLGEWEEGTFEMGFLEPECWRAKWIAGDYKPDKKKRYPVDCFQKEFSLSGKVKKARLYATARGIYDVHLNGKRIEDFILAPGVTDYRKRVQYQVYDVSEYLGKENKLEICLADGWYRGSIAAYGVQNVFGTQTSVMAQLEVTLEDGSEHIIGTDESFSWSNDGPIRFADLKDGEIYDASMSPSYSGKAVVIKPGLAPVASNNVSVREKETFGAKVLTVEDGTKILDFGQNIAGYLSFQIKGNKGKQVKFILGEVLGKDGKVDLSGIQETIPAKGWNNINLVKKLLGFPVKGEIAHTPKQEITFLCSGKKDNYKTKFAIFGFRYVEIQGLEEVNPEDFKAIAVYSDMEQTGEFSCSHALINQLYQNTVWSMKGNFLDVPTDCPTRERLGWTGDAQIFFDTGAYMMNTAPFFAKWLKDMEDNQYENGLLSAVVPFNGVEMMYKSTGSSVGWADAVYMIPYRYYKRFGDKKVLQQYWPMMKKYVDYLVKNLGLKDKKEGKKNPYNNYIYEKGIHLGEWLEPEKFRDKVYGTQAKHPEECTAYLYYTMCIMEEIAKLLGEKEYVKLCKEYADGAKEAYNALFVETGLLDTDRQAKLVRPLALGILDGEDKKKAEKRLVQAVENYDYCVGTGFLSTVFILGVLTNAGESETAYKMLENTKKPGWLGEVLDGATTIWENWEGDLSQNHYSPGAVCQWLFDTIGGISVDDRNHFTIAPIPGGTLTEARTVYQSVYGKVETKWRRGKDSIRYEITVPANTSAKIMLSDGEVREVCAGKYMYEV